VRQPHFTVSYDQPYEGSEWSWVLLHHWIPEMVPACTVLGRIKKLRRGCWLAQRREIGSGGVGIPIAFQDEPVEFRKQGEGADWLRKEWGEEMQDMAHLALIDEHTVGDES